MVSLNPHERLQILLLYAILKKPNTIVSPDGSITHYLQSASAIYRASVALQVLIGPRDIGAENLLHFHPHSSHCAQQLTALL